MLGEDKKSSEEEEQKVSSEEGAFDILVTKILERLPPMKKALSRKKITDILFGLKYGEKENSPAKSSNSQETTQHQQARQYSSDV